MSLGANHASWLTKHAYAHRGLHNVDVPENSLASFRAALGAGLGIECDIRKSVDGRAMVFHDAQLDRLTGRSGEMGRCSVGELTAIALAGSDERIPTLRDALDLVAGKVPLLLELKTDNGRPVGPLCRAVRRDLEGYGPQVAVMSFDPRVSAWFRKRQPQLLRGLVMTEAGARTLSGAVKRRLALLRAKPQFLAYDVRDLPSAFAARQARGGMPLTSWTVKTAEQLDTAIKAGAAPILEAAGVAAWIERT